MTNEADYPTFTYVQEYKDPPIHLVFNVQAVARVVKVEGARTWGVIRHDRSKPAPKDDILQPGDIVLIAATPAKFLGNPNPPVRVHVTCIGSKKPWDDGK